MRYYRRPETGEVVCFDLANNRWQELRCDTTTEYRARYVYTIVTSEQARELIDITQAEADQFRREADEANAAARGELFLARMRSTGMGL